MKDGVGLRVKLWIADADTDGDSRRMNEDALPIREPHLHRAILGVVPRVVVEVAVILEVLEELGVAALEVWRYLPNGILP